MRRSIRTTNFGNRNYLSLDQSDRFKCTDYIQYICNTYNDDDAYTETNKKFSKCMLIR